MGTTLDPTVIVQSVGPGRAGAEAEIIFTNGARYLTWDLSVVRAAERFAFADTPVVPAIRRSGSGNEYLIGLAEPDQPASASCYKHRWFWVQPMVLKCSKCGELKRSER